MIVSVTMAGLPPLFGFGPIPPPPPPPPLFYYLPPGALIPPFGVAYNNRQIAVVAKGYHGHRWNAVVRDGVILNEVGMFAKM